MKLFTTLNIIRSHDPCTNSWKKALKILGKTQPDDDPLSFEWILEKLGLDDALWGLRAVAEKDEAERDRVARLFACDCADRVMVVWFKHYPDDKRPQTAISVARKFANGEASRDEMNAAWAASSAAAWAAASAAARAAARAAASDAASDAEKKEQIKLFRKYFCEA